MLNVILFLLSKINRISLLNDCCLCLSVRFPFVSVRTPQTTGGLTHEHSCQHLSRLNCQQVGIVGLEPTRDKPIGF